MFKTLTHLIAQETPPAGPKRWAVWRDRAAPARTKACSHCSLQHFSPARAHPPRRRWWSHYHPGDKQGHLKVILLLISSSRCSPICCVETLLLRRSPRLVGVFWYLEKHQPAVSILLLLGPRLRLIQVIGHLFGVDVLHAGAPIIQKPQLGVEALLAWRWTVVKLWSVISIGPIGDSFL